MRTYWIYNDDDADENDDDVYDFWLSILRLCKLTNANAKEIILYRNGNGMKPTVCAHKSFYLSVSNVRIALTTK